MRLITYTPILFRQTPTTAPAMGGVVLFLAVLLFSTIAQAAVPAALGADKTRTERQAGLSSLPVPTQGAISAVLGRDQPAYHATPSGAGLAAQNPQHGLSVDFGPAGPEVISGAARLSMRLEAVGYGARLTPVAKATPKARANRIEYPRGDLTEWYANGPVGLQQGFTLQAPPPGVKAGLLTLALALSGDLKPALDQASNTFTLAAQSGQAVLRYRGLTALNATGRALPAVLKLAGQTLQLEVDDRHARYPLLIDPFIEAAKLTASDGLANHQFGLSVAVSGGTVVVGAPSDDISGNFHQGSAYVFVQPTGGWGGGLTESAKLTALDGAQNDGFCYSVAVSGDTVVRAAQVAAHRATGAPVTDLASVTVKAVSLDCSAGTTPDQIEEYASGSGLQNLSDGSYQFNWKTPKFYANSCKTLKLDIGGGVGQEHTALFQFK